MIALSFLLRLINIFPLGYIVFFDLSSSCHLLLSTHASLIAAGRKRPLKAHLDCCSLVWLLTDPGPHACWADPGHNIHSISLRCGEEGLEKEKETGVGGAGAWVTKRPQWLRETAGGRRRRRAAQVKEIKDVGGLNEKLWQTCCKTKAETWQ